LNPIDDLIGPESEGILLLARRCREHHDVGAEGVGEFDGHVAEAAKPMTPTFLPDPTPQCRSGEYVVIPAHSSGAAPAGSSVSGTRRTKCSSTTIRSE
jgi:hypothetical protein